MAITFSSEKNTGTQAAVGTQIVTFGIVGAVITGLIWGATRRKR